MRKATGRTLWSALRVGIRESGATVKTTGSMERTATMWHACWHAMSQQPLVPREVALFNIDDPPSEAIPWQEVCPATRSPAAIPWHECGPATQPKRRVERRSRASTLRFIVLARTAKQFRATRITQGTPPHLPWAAVKGRTVPSALQPRPSRRGVAHRAARLHDRTLKVR
jgi:hypothetical protein